MPRRIHWPLFSGLSRADYSPLAHLGRWALWLSWPAGPANPCQHLQLTAHDLLPEAFFSRTVLWNWAFFSRQWSFRDPPSHYVLPRSTESRIVVFLFRYTCTATGSY
jgi:hypothetical protein